MELLVNDKSIIKKLYHFDNKIQCSGWIYDVNGIAPTLCASMGEGGGIIPFIVVGVKINVRCKNNRADG